MSATTATETLSGFAGNVPWSIVSTASGSCGEVCLPLGHPWMTHGLPPEIAALGELDGATLTVCSAGRGPRWTTEFVASTTARIAALAALA